MEKVGAAAAITAAPTNHIHLPYVPALDGLRALGVIAVLLYHADLRGVPGGFLGVEALFVLSGYLITALLLAEWEKRERIDLRAFWLRRGQRLFPALILLVVATLALAVTALPGEVAGLRADALAALGGVTNWHLVLTRRSYFETIGRPSLLRHLWTLAVEAQFYLLWPLLLLLGLRRWPRWRLLCAILAAAAASAAGMALLYTPGLDPSRVYFGTDTRAAGLLVGAALAFVWPPGRVPVRGRAWALLLDGAGLMALGALAGACAWIDEFQPFLYRGGMACVALSTAAVVAAAVDPGTRLVPGLLGPRPLRWLGQRAYSLYLWHWPIFMVTRPQLDVSLDGLPLLALRLAATALLAELSYRCVETPLRRGALRRAWRALRQAQGLRRLRLGAAWAGVLLALAVCSIALGDSVVTAEPPAAPSYLSEIAATITAAAPIATTTADQPAPAAAAARATPTPASRDERASGATPLAATPSAPTATPGRPQEPLVPAAERTPRTPPVTIAPVATATPKAAATPTPTRIPIGPVTAIGDSVMLSAAPELMETIAELEIDAEVSRQACHAVQLLRARRDAGQLGDVVVIHLGSNGLFSAEQFDEIMAVLADVRRVVFVNLKVPRRWQEPINDMLADGVARYPNAALVDWCGASIERPELFRDDGVHMRPDGAQLYARLIAEGIQAP